MIEKHIVLEDVDPVSFYGIGNEHLQMLKSLFPKLRIMARDNVIKVLGDELEIAKIEKHIEDLRQHLIEHNILTDKDFLDIIKGKKVATNHSEDIVTYSVGGRPIKGKSAQQQQLIKAFHNKDLIFAVGPAGTGKTYLSIALAVQALKEKAVKKSFCHGRLLKLERN